MMPNTSFTNLALVAAIAFGAPLLLGFAPSLLVRATVIEILAGIVLGPSVFGWVTVDMPIQILALTGVSGETPAQDEAIALARADATRAFG